MTLFASYEPSEQAVLAALMASAEETAMQAKCPHLVLSVEEREWFREWKECFHCGAALSPEAALGEAE